MSAITPLIYQFGLGGIGGFIAGFALKKMMKLAAIVIGLFVIALIYLGYQGIISINYGALGNAVSGALGLTGTAAGIIAPIIAHLPFAGSFGLGFFLGLKIG